MPKEPSLISHPLSGFSSHMARELTKHHVYLVRAHGRATTSEVIYKVGNFYKGIQLLFYLPGK